MSDHCARCVLCDAEAENVPHFLLRYRLLTTIVREASRVPHGQVANLSIDVDNSLGGKTVHALVTAPELTMSPFEREREREREIKIRERDRSRERKREKVCARVYSNTLSENSIVFWTADFEASSVHKSDT
jgi:hypothetical protein